MAAPTAARVWPSRCDRAHAAQVGCVSRQSPTLGGECSLVTGRANPASIGWSTANHFRVCGPRGAPPKGWGPRCGCRRERKTLRPTTLTPSPSHPAPLPPAPIPRERRRWTRDVLGHTYNGWRSAEPPLVVVSRRGGWPAPAPHPSPVGHGGSETPFPPGWPSTSPHSYVPTPKLDKLDAAPDQAVNERRSARQAGHRHGHWADGRHGGGGQPPREGGQGGGGCVAPRV